MKIADNILAYIRANGIRQKIIVDKCGWSKQKVYSMLHGINRISVEEYGMICKALGYRLSSSTCITVRIRQTPPAAADGVCWKLVCCCDECF